MAPIVPSTCWPPWLEIIILSTWSAARQASFGARVPLRTIGRSHCSLRAGSARDVGLGAQDLFRPFFEFPAGNRVIGDLVGEHFGSVDLHRPAPTIGSEPPLRLITDYNR